MIDLVSLMGDVLDGLDRLETPVFPTKVGNQEGGGNDQTTDINKFPTVPTVPTAKQILLQDETYASHLDHNAQVRARGEFMYFGGKSGIGGKCLQEQGPILPTTTLEGGNRWERPSAGEPQAGPRLSSGAARSGWADLAPVTPPPAPASEIVEAWRAAFYLLNSTEAPCPGFRLSMDWRQTFDAAHAFLEQHAEQAHALGWGALDLFAVHHVVGGSRVDCCGAVMLMAGSLVASIERDVIALNRAQDGQPVGRFFRTPRTSEMVAIWDFRR